MPTISTAVGVRMWRLAIAVVVVCALYFLREIIQPVAVAALITFVLAPIVSRLERKLGRTISVFLTVGVAFTIIGLVAWMSTIQIVDLARKLPTYKANLLAKVQSLNTSGKGPFAGVSRMIEEIEHETATPQLVRPSDSTAPQPVPVEVVDHPKQSTSKLLATVGHMVEPLASVGVIIVLAIFMLLKRDDLRDRIIGLIGRGRIGNTTGAMRDASRRVNRFLLMNLLTNVAFGVPVSVGLYFIGVPSAPLWGLLAMLLRFIPFVGILVATAFPVVLSLAVFDNWSGPLMTLGLFLSLELIIGNVVEPWLYGASTGVSAFALIVAALFWTWLWGPIGLILSTPLTVCLLVLGKNIPQLGFLGTVLSEESALASHEKCYHRLLAADRRALNDIVDAGLRDQLIEQVYSSTLLPALALIQNDFQRRTLDRDENEAVLVSVREIVDQLEDRVVVAAGKDSAQGESEDALPAIKIKILCLPAETLADEVSAAMLAQVARAHRFAAEALSSKLSVHEIARAVSDREPDWVWICAINPVGLSRCRHLCGELHRAQPERRISVAIWHPEEHLRDAIGGLRQAGAESVSTSFGEALLRLEALRDSYKDSFAAAPLPVNEVERVAALIDSGLLKQGEDELFDRTTSELTKIFNVPIALVSLVDSGWQHFASQCGLGTALAEEGRTGRDVSVCGHVVAANRPFVVEDLARDRRFAGNPLLRAHKLRFYAGVPLRTKSGLAIGSLCILDHRPRTVSDREIRLMQMIAENLMLGVESRAAKAGEEVPSKAAVVT